MSLSKFKTMHLIPSTNSYYEANYNSQTYGFLARKYISVSDNFLFSLEGSTGIRWLSSTQLNLKEKGKETGFEVELRPAFTFLPHPKWGIEAAIGLLSYKKNARQFGSN